MMQEWEDNEPDGAGSRSRGATPRDRMASAKSRQRKRIGNKQVDAYNKIRERAIDTRRAVESDLSRIEAERIELLNRLRQGLDGPEDAQSHVSLWIALTNRMNDALSSIERDGEIANAEVDLDPAEFEARWLEKFPVLEQSLPLITEDWLLGEDDRDPLGGAR